MTIGIGSRVKEVTKNRVGIVTNIKSKPCGKVECQITFDGGAKRTINIVQLELVL